MTMQLVDLTGNFNYKTKQISQKEKNDLTDLFMNNYHNRAALSQIQWGEFLAVDDNSWNEESLLDNLTSQQYARLLDDLRWSLGIAANLANPWTTNIPFKISDVAGGINNYWLNAGSDSFDSVYRQVLLEGKNEGRVPGRVIGNLAKKIMVKSKHKFLHIRIPNSRADRNGYDNYYFLIELDPTTKGI